MVAPVSHDAESNMSANDKLKSGWTWYTHTHTHTHTHTRTHARTHARTRTHTHTHTLEIEFGDSTSLLMVGRQKVTYIHVCSGLVPWPRAPWQTVLKRLEHQTGMRVLEQISWGFFTSIPQWTSAVWPWCWRRRSKELQENWKKKLKTIWTFNSFFPVKFCKEKNYFFEYRLKRKMMTTPSVKTFCNYHLSWLTKSSSTVSLCLKEQTCNCVTWVMPFPYARRPVFPAARWYTDKRFK